LRELTGFGCFFGCGRATRAWALPNKSERTIPNATITKIQSKAKKPARSRKSDSSDIA